VCVGGGGGGGLGIIGRWERRRTLKKTETRRLGKQIPLGGGEGGSGGHNEMKGIIIVIGSVAPCLERGLV